MFRNIISNLPFSPALVGQLGFYAKRLRKEEATRRVGLIFTVLALVMQSFAVFTPPEAANASSRADFVSGGVTSVNDFLKSYDKNSRNIKSIFSSLGITRDEIKAAKKGTVGKKGYYNWSMTSLYSSAQGQRSYKYYTSSGSSGTAYYRPMSLTQEGKSPYPVYIGHSKKFGWFAIKKDCGNLVTNKKPPADKPPTSSCSNLTATKLSRTKVRFSAKAAVAGGAKIKSYTFTVKTNDGKTVDSKKITSTSKTTDYTYQRDKPGAYTVSVVVDTSLGKKSDKDCKANFTVEALATPTAVCSSLRSQLVGRNNIELTGTATVSGGATISQYTFTVKDHNGNTVSTKTIATTATSAAADAIVLNKPGDYVASLTVTTNLGVKTDSTDCVAQIKIVPPEMCSVKPELPANSPDCQPCPGDSSIWIKDEKCESNVVNTKTATNMTQDGVEASSVTAKASDRISYTINVENTGLIATTTDITEQLHDVLQYTSVVDEGGGTLDKDAETLSWPSVELKAGEKQSRTFVVQLASKIAATNTGTSDAASYDCVMTNTFGNSIDVRVNCPIEKVAVEQVVKELPHTGPRENMIFAGVLLSVVVYFYARSRQMNKEVRLVRRDLNAGTI